MADRYWVGGTGNWDASTTTNWSASSGGASGASVPTSSDNVIFDTLSNATAYTVTVTATANCANLTLGPPLAGAQTFAGSSDLNIYGNFSVGATTVMSYAATITFRATSGTKTIATNGVTQNSIIVFNGSGGTFQLSDNFTIGQSITNTAGTFDANTKAVIFSEYASSHTITGTFTFYDLTFVGTTAVTNRTITFANSVTVSNTFTITGESAKNRVLVKSSTLGTAVTITAATTSLTNVDFKDITGAGAAAWTGTSFGNCGGNSGVTTTTPVNRYWIGGTGNWSDTAEWSTSSGGGGGASFPLPQDTAYFDANSFSAGSQVVTLDIPRPGAAMDWTGATNTPALNFSVSVELYNNITWISGMTLSGTGQMTYQPSGSRTFIPAGLTRSMAMVIERPSQTVTLGGNLGGGEQLTHSSGTFNANGYTVGATNFYSSSSITRTLTFGAGIWTLSGGAFQLTSTGLTTDLDTSSITFSGATVSITGYSTMTWGTVNLSNAAGAYTVAASTQWTGTTLTLAGSATLALGNSVGWDWDNVTPNTSAVTFNGSGSKTITLNSQSFYDVIFNKNSGTTITLNGNMVANTITHTKGTINADTFNVTCVSFASSNANTRILTMGSGTWTITGTGTIWDMTTVTGLTVSATTSTIIISDTSATSKTFIGGDKTFGNITFSGDDITVTGSNGFANFNINNANEAEGLILTSGTTQTVTDVTTNGFAANLARILSSSAASAATVSSTNPVDLNYIYIKDITAAGSVPFYAGANSTDGTGNTNITFTARPAPATGGTATMMGI